MKTFFLVLCRLKRERSPVRGDSERQKDQTLEDISDISDDDNVGCIRDAIGIENSGNVRSSPAERRSRSPKLCRREGRKPMEAPNAKRNKVNIYDIQDVVPANMVRIASRALLNIY